MIGSWVTRSKSHTIEHLVIAERDGILHTSCMNRIRANLAETVTKSRGGIFVCQACAHRAHLMETRVVEYAA